MLSFRTALVASAITLALGMPAFAQDIMMEIRDRGGIIVEPSGKVMRMTLNDKSHAMMMKYGHPVKAGTIFFMSGGALYVAQDRMMSNGVSLREMLIRSF
jgi:hypothetical protein